MPRGAAPPDGCPPRSPRARHGHRAALWNTQDGSPPCSTGLGVLATAQGLGGPQGGTHRHIPWTEQELTDAMAAPPPPQGEGPSGPRLFS